MQSGRGGNQIGDSIWFVSHPSPGSLHMHAAAEQAASLTSLSELQEWAKEEKRRQTEEEARFGALPRSAAKSSMSARKPTSSRPTASSVFASPDRRPGAYAQEELGPVPDNPRRTHRGMQSASKSLRCTPVVMGKESLKKSGMGSPYGLRTPLTSRQEGDAKGEGVEAAEDSVHRNLQF